MMVVFFVSCGSAPRQVNSAGKAPVIASAETTQPPKQKPYRSLRDVNRGLAEWEEYFAQRNEPQAAFFTAYIEITKTLILWINNAKFNDDSEVTRYIVAFAEEGHKGIFSYCSGGSCPQSWRNFGEENGGEDSDITTSLLLGINAHINRDLVYAVLSAAIDTSLESSRIDHERITDALIEAAPEIRSQITQRYQPGKLWVNRMFGWYIDHELRRVFGISRNRAWKNAIRLKSARTKAEREKIELEIEQRSAEIARRIIALEGKYAQQLWAIASP